MATRDKNTRPCGDCALPATSWEWCDVCTRFVCDDCNQSHDCIKLNGEDQDDLPTDDAPCESEHSLDCDDPDCIGECAEDEDDSDDE